MKKNIRLIIIIFALSYPSKLISIQLKPALISKETKKEIICKIPLINSRSVRATAYNAVEGQTDDTPTICAWGDKIHDGVVAVSRDLEKLGLKRNKEVYVEKAGKKVVKDRMHRRKLNQIDVFMEKVKDAKKFGRRTLKAIWITDYVEVCMETTTITYQLDTIFIHESSTKYTYCINEKEFEELTLTTLGEMLCAQ